MRSLDWIDVFSGVERDAWCPDIERGAGAVARVQKALERLPYFGVFDFLAFGVDRGTVTLFGYAYRGSLKTEPISIDFERCAGNRRQGPASGSS